MGQRLEHRVAIVTGAGRGIGRSVAKLLAEEGASVIVNDLGGSVEGASSSVSPADAVVSEIREDGGTASANYDSVAEFGSAGKIVEMALEEFGRVDILCNAAGILRDRMVFNMSPEEWEAVIRVHLLGSFNVTRQALPYMVDQNYGRVVLFSSISALGSPGQSNYSAAKEGVVGLARSLAVELGNYNISVNAVYPGGSTRMVASIPDSAREWLREQAQKSPGSYPVADLVASPEPEEALVPESNAAKIVYLCTEVGGAINGEVIGTHGWSMSRYFRRFPTKSVYKGEGQWTLEEIGSVAPISLAVGLVNPAPKEE